MLIFGDRGRNRRWCWGNFLPQPELEGVECLSGHDLNALGIGVPLDVEGAEVKTRERGALPLKDGFYRAEVRDSRRKIVVLISIRSIRRLWRRYVGAQSQAVTAAPPGTGNHIGF